MWSGRGVGERGKSWEKVKFVLRTKFEVLTAVLVKIKTFWVVQPSLLVVTDVWEQRSACLFRVCQFKKRISLLEGFQTFPARPYCSSMNL